MLAFSCTLEDCSLAVGQVVRHNSIKPAGHMSNDVVIFVEAVEKATMVVENGMLVNDVFVSVRPLPTKN